MKQFNDFPEPGMTTIYMKSIDDDRFKTRKGLVRAQCHIMALTTGPAGVNAHGEDLTSVTLTTNVDIKGLVPTFIVNFAARSAPAQWFVDCQKAVDLFAKGKFNY